MSYRRRRRARLLVAILPLARSLVTKPSGGSKGAAATNRSSTTCACSRKSPLAFLCRLGVPDDVPLGQPAAILFAFHRALPLLRFSSGGNFQPAPRSEERRVGYECTCG